MGFFAAAAALATPPPATSRVQLAARGDFGYALLSEQRLLSGAAGMSLSFFARRALVDDDAPLSLQPFLQRADVVYMSATGGGFETGSSIISQRGRHGGATVGFNIHVAHWAALTASVGVMAGQSDAGASVPSRDWLWLPAAIGFGLRWQDVRFDASYRVTTHQYNGEWRTPFFGNALLSGHLVHARKLSVHVDIEVVDRGALAGSEVGLYVDRRLGLTFGVFGGRGILYFDERLERDRLGGHIGVSGWWSRHLGAALSYSPYWTSAPIPGPAGALVTHAISLSIFSRAR